MCIQNDFKKWLIWSAPRRPISAIKTYHYAVGYRYNEVGLPTETENKKCSILIHNNPKSRRVNFVCLDDEFYVRGLAPISPDLNDPATLRNGFAKRVCRDTPIANQLKLGELRLFIKRWLQQHHPNKVTVYSFEEWLASTNYNETRKNQLRKAKVQLDDYYGGFAPVKKCHKVESHPKVESYPEYKNARGINARPDLFKVWFGPICKAIESEIFQDEHFIKHTTPEQRILKIQALADCGMPYCYSTDFTAFESHFTPQVMAAIDLVMFEHFMNSPDYTRLSQILGGRNKMVMRCGFTATCDARRMSGEMNTSLSNGFANLMLALFIAHKKRGSLKGLVEGDDGLFCTDFEMSSQDYLDLGFTIKMKREETPFEASFCGLIVSPFGEVIKDPKRFLQKFAWSDKYMQSSRRVHSELMLAKAMSALSECPQCPIIGVVARKCYYKHSSSIPRFIYDGYHDIIKAPLYHIPEFNPNFQTRLLFEKIFNISISRQLLIERLVNDGNTSSIVELLTDGVDKMSMDNWTYENKYVMRVPFEVISK